MKVFMLSNPAAIHTQRWVSALAKRGVEIMLYSFYPCEKVDYYRGIKHVQVKSFWQSRDSKGIKGFILVKLFTYYRALIKDIRNSIQTFHPDIVHAHYLSDNGLFGALAGFHPFVVSAWGTDVYDYPRRSWSRVCVIKYILKKADRVLSTSHVMARELARYTDKKQIPVTPFGVDMTLFKRFPKKHQETDGFVFGIVKTLEYGYGIDTLIDALEILQKQKLESMIYICNKMDENNIVEEDLAIIRALENDICVEFLICKSMHSLCTRYLDQMAQKRELWETIQDRC